MVHSLTENAVIQRLKIDGTNYILAAGTTDVDSDVIDMLGFEAVAIVLGLGTLAASSSVTSKVAQSDDDDGSPDGFSDLTGTSQATADTTNDDNKTIIWDVYRPTKRYLRVTSTRGDGGNSTIDFMLAIKYRCLEAAVTQHATNLAIERFASPAEGTA